MGPTTNIEFGTALLAYLRNTNTARHPDDAAVRIVTAGYFGGEASAKKVRALKEVGPKTTRYAENATRMWVARDAPSPPKLLDENL